MTLQPREIEAAIDTGETEQLRHWLESGELRVNQGDIMGPPVIHDIVRKGTPEQLLLFVEYGNSLSQRTTGAPETLLGAAIRAQRGEMLDLLIALGANIEQLAHKELTPLLTAAEAFGMGENKVVFYDRLVVAGANQKARSVEKKNSAQLAIKHPDSALKERIKDYEAFEACLAAGGISLHYLQAQENVFSGEPSFMHIPGIWRWSFEITQQLTQRGENLTKESLLAPVGEGKSMPLKWIILAGQLDVIQAHLICSGQEPIEFSDFVDEKKNPTPLFQSLCEAWGHKQLFSSEWVKHLSKEQLRKLYAGVAEPKREIIYNIHSLTAKAPKVVTASGISENAL